MAADFELTDGFDKYGVVGMSGSALLALMLGEWTSTPSTTQVTSSLVAGLSGPGACAFKIAGLGNGSGSLGLYASLPNNYARVLISATLNSGASNSYGVGFTLTDNSTSTDQVSVGLTPTGHAYYALSNLETTAAATSTVSVIPGTTHSFEADVTIHPTAGIVKIWLDNVLVLNLSGINTRSSSNSTFSLLKVAVGANNSGATGTCTFDNLDVRCYLASGGSDTAYQTSPVIETDFPTSDSSVQFTASAGVLGQDYSITSGTNAPGANELFLRQFTPIVNATINSVTCLPEATSATANFKAVIYSDSGGSPHTLLSSGTQVTGCTSGTVLTGALTTPQSLTAGTPYWIGFITDTSVALAEVDTTTTGEKASNTYTSNAPATAPTMTTGQSSWIIFGNCTGMAHNYAQVTNVFNNPPLGDLDYNSDTVVGHEDLFNFPAISTTAQNVYTLSVKGYLNKSDSGARTVGLQTKSGTTDSSGSAGSTSPGLTYQWYASYFSQDPNTSAAWTVANLNAALSGYKIAS